MAAMVSINKSELLQEVHFAILAHTIANSIPCSKQHIRLLLVPWKVENLQVRMLKEYAL